MSKRLRVSPGFLVLLALLFYLDEGLGLLGWSLLACALHELGHIAAILFMGGRVRWLRLTAVGAELGLDERRPFSYGQEAAAALAGPAASLLTAWLAAQSGLFLLAGLSLGQGLFNLLPLTPLDGGRCLLSILSAWAGEERADRVMSVVSAALTGLLVGAGLILVKQFGNLTLLITAVWLGAGALKHLRAADR